jgi:hypothetical protein
MNLLRISHLLLIAGFTCFAQDVKVNGNSSAQSVLKSTNTNTSAADRIGMEGYSVPVANYGIGARGTGGWHGADFSAEIAGTGTRTGVNATASNGVSWNMGINAVATGTGNSSTKYGGQFSATGDGIKYGIFTSASGTGTNYSIYCNGPGVYTSTWTKISDMRAKKNIKEYSGALEKIMAVSVKSYDFDQASYPSMNLKTKSEIGLIAQDLEKVLPDLVSDIVSPVFSGDDEKSKTLKSITLKGVDYISLVPILLQAIKEQQAQINALQKKIGG